jgi:hypothetical protein
VRYNAEYRGYDITGYSCAGALMSPADLGKIFWLRTTGHWIGPCLSVDTAARKDFARAVYRDNEIAEIDYQTSHALGFEFGSLGEIWIGACPPVVHSVAHEYRPEFSVDTETPELSYLSSYWPYNKQQPGRLCR